MATASFRLLHLTAAAAALAELLKVVSMAAQAAEQEADRQERLEVGHHHKAIMGAYRLLAQIMAALVAAVRVALERQLAHRL